MKAHPHELGWEHHHQLYYVDSASLRENTFGSGGSSAEAALTKI